MEQNPVGWFEIPVSDLDRAVKFYETVLDIKMGKRAALDGGYEMVWFPSKEGAAGATGALFKGEGYTPGKMGAVVYFSCTQIDEAIKRAESLNSEVILPKKSIGEYGYIAWLTDSEGNIVALHTQK